MNFLTDEQRAAVVAEAREWVQARTPYVSHAKKKGLGCDCGTFIIAVYQAAGFVGPIDLGNYSTQAHLHKPVSAEAETQQTQYVDVILRYCDEITETEALPGDMVIFRVARAFAHGAIIEQWPRVIHSVSPEVSALDGVVYSDANVDSFLKGRPRRFFRRNFDKN